MKFFSLLSIFFFTSCATQNLSTSPARMISPETQGDFGKISLEARVIQYRRDKAAFRDNTKAKPFEKTHGGVAPAFHGELGLLKKLDVYVSPNFFLNAPTVVGGKFQLLGKDRHSAKKGNFSLALIAGLGSHRGGAEDSHALIEIGSSTSLSDNVKDISYKTDHQEVGAIVGYRWHDRLVHYLGGNYFHQYIHGNITTENKTLNNARFDFQQNGFVTATGLIYYFEEIVYLKAEYSYMTSAMSFSRSYTTNSGNFAIGMSF